MLSTVRGGEGRSFPMWVWFLVIAHLGPMARLVVMNESREAKTPEDLFRGPRSGYPDLADAIAENGLHQMFCSR